MMQRKSNVITLFITAAIFVHTAASCTFKTKFWEFKDDAPLRSISNPPAYVGDNFGSIFAPLSLHSDTTGAPEEFDGDYLAVAGSPASEIAILRFASGGDLEDGDTFYRYPFDFDDNFPDTDFAASIAPAPVWQLGAETYFGCFVIGVPGSERIEIIDIDGFHFTHPVSLIDSAGMSVDAVVRLPDQPVDGFIVGGSSGAVFVPADISSEGHVLEVPPPLVAPPSVTSVTSGSLGGGIAPYLAFGSDGAIYVFLWNDASAGYHLEECVEHFAPGFGSTIVSEDVDGDGLDDLLISGTTAASNRFKDVAVIPGLRYNHPPTSVPTVCTGLESLTLLAEFSCSDIEEKEITCGDNPLFGSSITAGDLDGDGFPEIIIGAPNAAVAGKSGAGTAFIFNAGSPEPISALRVAHPGENDHLGVSVAVLNIAGRDEVFTGMPEDDRVLLFYCSGAGDDTSPPGDKFCRP